MKRCQYYSLKIITLTQISSLTLLEVELNQKQANDQIILKGDWKSCKYFQTFYSTEVNVEKNTY